MIELLNMCCMEYMRGLPDKAFDLAIVDPPYGIGEASSRMATRHHTQRKYAVKGWDTQAPPPEYFKELMRVSRNQIIWGANHFISRMPMDSSCWIFWDKDRYGDFADGELAWSSFPTAVRYFKFTWDGFRKGEPCDRTHPTQKPVALYRWLLKNYAKPGDKILDTHLGSGSSAIAADIEGFDFVGMEIDADYFSAATKRLKDHQSAPRLFTPEALQQPIQLSMEP